MTETKTTINGKAEDGAIFGFYRKSLLVLFIGALGVAMLVAVVVLREREFQGSLLNEAVMELQRSTLLFHIKTEERLGASMHAHDAADEELREHMAQAKRAAKLLTEGGAAIGGRYIKPAVDETVKRSAEEILKRLDDLEAMGLARWSGKGHDGGAGADEAHMAKMCRIAYADIMAKTTVIEQVFHHEITENYSKKDKLIYGIGVAWFVVTFFSALGLNVVEGRRKRAASELSLSEARYRLIASTSFEGIILSDGEKVIEVNDAAEHIFGRAKDDLVGMELAELMPPRYRGAHLAGIKRFLETGERRIHGKVIEAEGLRKNGEAFPVELMVNSFSIDDSVYISATVRDISERKHVESEREKLIADLKDAVGKIKVLKGLIPICAYCKKMRDDKGYWQKVETYVAQRTEAEFTHGICETCAKALKEENESLLRGEHNGEKPR